jgi:hypothetical protein
MRRSALTLALACALVAATPALAQRQVNVTPDSKPGWIPPVDLEKQAVDTTLAYLGAMDTGQIDAAWAMLDPHDQTQEPIGAYANRVTAFNALAGQPLQRRVTKVTWTADSDQAPEPGVYVALDLISRFGNVDRHCGYIVLHQPPLGGPFKVIRQEDNFLTDAQAKEIAAGGGDVDAAWAQLSARCPNYVAGRGPAPLPPLAESKDNGIGYPNPDAALAGLKAKPGIQISSKDGWTVINDPADGALWSFPPPGHPAFPSAVKRTPVQKDGQVIMNLQVICAASKTACDDLVRSFQALDAQISAEAAKPKS